MLSQHDADQQERITAYRQAIDTAIREDDQEAIAEYEDQLRDELLEDTHLGRDREALAAEAVYWHRTRDLFDHEEVAEAFPDSTEQQRCVYELGDQMMEHGTITSIRNGDGKLHYHLLTAEDITEYASHRGEELDPDTVEDELAQLRDRLPVSQIEERYPSLQDEEI